MKKRIFILLLLLLIYGSYAQNKYSNDLSFQNEHEKIWDRTPVKNKSFFTLDTTIIPLTIGNRWVYSARGFSRLNAGPSNSYRFSTVKEVIGYKEIEGVITAVFQVDNLYMDYQTTRNEYWSSDTVNVYTYEGIPYLWYDKSIKNDTSFTIIRSDPPYIIYYGVYHEQDTLWNNPLQIQMWAMGYEYKVWWKKISPGIGEVGFGYSYDDWMVSQSKSADLVGAVINDSIYGSPAPPLWVSLELLDRSIRLFWNMSYEQNVIYYKIYGGLQNSVLQLLDSTSTRQDTTCLIANLEKKVKYAFRITAVNSHLLESQPSTQVKYSLANSIPIASKLLSPANGDTIDLEKDIFFNWSQSFDADSDSIFYILKIWNQSSDTLISNLSDTLLHFQINQFFQRDNMYYWSVWVSDRFDATYSNNINQFYVSPEPPPSSYVLFQNYPNPFNPKTNIKFNLPKLENVKLEIFNLLGQRIKTLLKKQLPAGSYEIEFTAKDLPSGIYLYRFEAGKYQEVEKMILLR